MVHSSNPRFSDDPILLIAICLSFSLIEIIFTEGDFTLTQHSSFETMRRFFLLLVLLPFFSFGQTSQFPSNKDLTKIYTQAIADFIKSANTKNKSRFDTLFFGDRKNGQPDDFPAIKLPSTIEQTQIRLITPEEGAKKQKEIKSRIYINLMGWVNTSSAEFIFVVFSNGFAHQYDYHLNYNYSKKSKAFELSKLEFKGPPFNK